MSHRPPTFRQILAGREFTFDQLMQAVGTAPKATLQALTHPQLLAIQARLTPTEMTQFLFLKNLRIYGDMNVYFDTFVGQIQPEATIGHITQMGPLINLVVYFTLFANEGGESGLLTADRLARATAVRNLAVARIQQLEEAASGNADPVDPGTGANQDPTNSKGGRRRRRRRSTRRRR